MYIYVDGNPSEEDIVKAKRGKENWWWVRNLL